MNIHYKNIFIKLLVFFILLIVIGLPINNAYYFYILLIFLPIIIYSKISIKKRSLYFLLVLIFIFSIVKFSFQTIAIQEGHNLVIVNKNSSNFYKNNLPEEIYNFFNKEYIIHYSNSKCDEQFGGCWKNFNPDQYNSKSSPTNNIFATSSDWSFNKIKYSRIVNNINLTNIKSAKIGAINNLDYNFFWNDITDIDRENTPFFVMYEISKELIDNSICWKGNLFWENNNNSFSHEINKNYACKKIVNSDVGNKIYAISMGTKNELILNLENNIKLKSIVIINLFLMIVIFIYTIYSFFSINYKLYFISLLSCFSFILIIFYVNKDLIFGFDIFSGGNDGLVYMSYGNVIFNNLANFNFYEALRGVESVFYFPSSLRYFWSINKIFFGELFFGYLIIGFLFPLIYFYIFKYLFGSIWSFIITFIVIFTRLFEGYALSLVTMIQHINTGDAEPLAIFFMLSSLLIFLKFTNQVISIESKFYSFLIGFLLFLSVSLRPNFLPTALIFILILTFYNFYYHKNIKSSFFIGLGFFFVLLIPLHNYYYGNSYVLLSSGYGHDTYVPVSLYFDVFKDLINLKLNAGITTINSQINRWIQPKEIHYILTFMIIITLLIKNNNFVIKTICLLALSQHSVLLIFRPDNRYSYLAWILTIILCLYFIKNNLMPFIKKFNFPNKVKNLF